jgi:hypothetical protein
MNVSLTLNFILRLLSARHATFPCTSMCAASEFRPVTEWPPQPAVTHQHAPSKRLVIHSSMLVHQAIQCYAPGMIISLCHVVRLPYCYLRSPGHPATSCSTRHHTSNHGDITLVLDYCMYQPCSTAAVRIRCYSSVWMCTHRVTACVSPQRRQLPTPTCTSGSYTQKHAMHQTTISFLHARIICRLAEYD